ncbi:PREDICTED: uncharacterized protein LOC105622646 [Atta cephalotes]|uniref:Neurotransmitter-gated ion-channel transmembrane domain-containing protein n=2 Tax=Atta TaxID=12956 RepID=A0A158NPJ3_ATTCE|nr:PREDICTED: uncharacterized protein LOC105622646 [Atta cephalotes]
MVESQKDYHARRKHHHSRMTTAKTTTAAIASTTRSPASTTATTAVEQVEDNQIPEVTKWPTTEPTETWEITTTTISTTPSTTTTTTPTPRFCVVQRSNTHSQQYIREGKGKRLYREDEPECSELCVCAEGEQLVCNTLCVETLPCKTDFAFYNHEAPAYQAHRGPCLCYSGGFICMRPSPDTYSIPHGVFMFLGYSEKDETLLKQYNNVTVLDAVSSLDNFMRKEVNNQTVCTLFLYNATRENVIAVARLGTDNPPLNSSQAQSLQHLLRVKEECASMMQDLSDKINNKHHEVRTHPLLSIFKMAEVEVKMPYSNEAAISRSSSVLLVVLLTLVLSCAMKFESYPHDTQICSMMIESLSHTTQDLVFLWNMTDPLVVNPEIELPQLDISNNYTTDCTIEYSTGNFTCIQIVFNLRRRLGYHLFHTYIPSALIVVMSWIAFWIKPEAIPARVTLGVTSLLTLATQNTQSQQSLPPVSYVKAIDVWMSSCSVFVFLSLMEFAVVNNYMGPIATKAMKGYSDEDLREAIDDFKTPMRPDTERSRSPTRQSTIQYECCQGRATAIYIDKVSRFFFPFSFFILNVVYWSTFL